MKGNILIKEASVSTLSVEIKAIHINNRQLTLSIFKQIPEESILDANYEIKGVVWGRVNYFWKGFEQERSSTIHIVWSNGNELRRDRFTNWSQNDFIRESLYYNLKRQIEDLDNYIKEVAKDSPYMSRDISYLYEEVGHPKQPKWVNDESEKREAVAHNETCAQNAEKAKKALIAKLNNELDTAISKHKKASDAYNVFLNSPQLYIAA